MPNSRTKGAQFEREVAKLLLLELGISFKRDLRQYQTGGHGDLIPDDPAFPFELELKRYAHGPISEPTSGGSKSRPPRSAAASGQPSSTSMIGNRSARWSRCRASAATSALKTFAT